MSDSGATTPGPPPPPDPLNELWYVQVSAHATLHRGHEIKAMLERGSIGARTWVAKVGASQWSQLADVPAFAGLGALRNAIHYAGFWMRVLAYIIDQFIVYVLILAVSFTIAIAAVPMAGGRLSPEVSVTIVLLIVASEIAIVIGYYVISLSSRWQATPGKRLCRIYVIRTDGRRIGRGLAFGRYLSVLLSFMTFYVGIIMVAFTDQKKGLHDIICSTRVIYGKAEDEVQIAEVFA